MFRKLFAKKYLFLLALFITITILCSLNLTAKAKGRFLNDVYVPSSVKLGKTALVTVTYFTDEEGSILVNFADKTNIYSKIQVPVEPGYGVKEIEIDIPNHIEDKSTCRFTVKMIKGLDPSINPKEEVSLGVRVNETNLEGKKIDSKLYYDFPISYFEDQFIMHVGSTNHPDRKMVTINKCSNNNTQYGIEVFTTNTYGSNFSRINLNLETGLIISETNEKPEEMLDNITIPSPYEGGNLFNYINKLNKMKDVISSVRNGYLVYPNVSPKRPELDETINYIDLIIDNLNNSSIESVYLKPIYSITPLGKYNITIEHKTTTDRSVEINLIGNNNVLITEKFEVKKGIGNSSIDITIPSEIRNIRKDNKAFFEVSLLDINYKNLLCKYRNVVNVEDTNNIKLFRNNSSVKPGNKFDFDVIYSICEKGFLEIQVFGTSSNKLYSNIIFDVSEGANLKKTITLKCPIECKNEDSLKINILLKDKSNNLLSEQYFYQGIEK